MTKTRKTPPSKPTLKWSQSTDSGDPGDIAYWGNVKGYPDLCFSVWVCARVAGKQWEIELAAWTDKGDNPSVSYTLKLPKGTSMDDILARVPEWQRDIVGCASTDLANKAALVEALA